MFGSQVGSENTKTFPESPVCLPPSSSFTSRGLLFLPITTFVNRGLLWNHHELSTLRP